MINPDLLNGIFQRYWKLASINADFTLEYAGHEWLIKFFCQSMGQRIEDNVVDFFCDRNLHLKVCMRIFETTNPNPTYTILDQRWSNPESPLQEPGSLEEFLMIATLIAEGKAR
jgi:hypothetical protein